MITLTINAAQAALAPAVQPNLVLAIDGYANIFGALDTQKYIDIGDPGLVIGNDWTIGELSTMAGSKPDISFDGGATTSQLQQQIAPDKGQGSSITQVTIRVLDVAEGVSNLISPGFQLTDIIGVNVQLKVGFHGTAYPVDYVTVFRGMIQGISSGAGYIDFILASAEDKKRKAVFSQNSSPLNLAIDDVTMISTINVIDGTVFKVPVNGPNGSPDTSISYFVRIDDELFSYTGVTANQLTGVTRGALGTTLAAHTLTAPVQTAYRLQGNGCDLALKIMLSGWNGAFKSAVPVTMFNNLYPSTTVQNAIYFANLDVIDLYGLAPGDYVTITGASNGANNVTARQIAAVESTGTGDSFVVLDGSDMVAEGSIVSPSTAVCAFRSQYDSLGQGLKMWPVEVDVAEHQRLQSIFLGAFIFDFMIFSIDDAKSWLEDQLYFPMACVSIPRKGRSSLMIHVGPLGGDSIPTLNTTNVLNADQLTIQRATTQNFANQVEFDYDFDPIKGAYNTPFVQSSPSSFTRIAVQPSPITIQSEGLKTANGAPTLAGITANKLLGRYQYGAEFILGIQMAFGSGFPMECGDLVLIDFASLKLTDVITGNRNGGQKIFEIFNCQPDYASGAVTIDVVETSFGVNERYAVISPSSQIGAGATTKRLPLLRSFATPAYKNESYKWTEYIGQDVLVHDVNWTYQYTSTIIGIDQTVNPPVMNLSPALTAAPGLNDVVQCVTYPTSTDPNSEIIWKTKHAFLSPTVSVVSSPDQTHFVVSSGDIGKFKVGAIVRVHPLTFSQDSGEIVVDAVNTGTNTVTMHQASGFTITSAHKVDFIGFADGGQAYRFI